MSDSLQDWLDEPTERFAKPARAAKGTRKAKPEDVLHISAAKILKLALGPAGICNGAGALWFSQELRNAGKTITTKQGRTINLEGIRRKAAGCVAGLPDIVVIYSGRYHGIELKTEVGRLSEAQHEVHSALCHAGAITAVARSVEDVVKLLEAWRIPHRGLTF